MESITPTQMSEMPELPSQFTQIVLNERPTNGPIRPSTFKTVKKPFEELKSSMKDTDVLLQVDYCSLDPAMRGWLNDRRSYIEPVKIGAVMRSVTLCTVISVGDKVQNVKVGDLVSASAGE